LGGFGWLDRRGSAHAIIAKPSPKAPPRKDLGIHRRVKDGRDIYEATWYEDGRHRRTSFSVRKHGARQARAPTPSAPGISDWRCWVWPTTWCCSTSFPSSPLAVKSPAARLPSSAVEHEFDVVSSPETNKAAMQVQTLVRGRAARKSATLMAEEEKAAKLRAEAAALQQQQLMEAERKQREKEAELERRRVEQLEQRALLGVVGAGRIAGRRPDADVLLGDQLVVRQYLVGGVAPQLAAHLRVQDVQLRDGRQ
jgi:hypothetical protein